MRIYLYASALAFAALPANAEWYHPGERLLAHPTIEIPAPTGHIGSRDRWCDWVEVTIKPSWGNGYGVPCESSGSGKYIGRPIIADATGQGGNPARDASRLPEFHLFNWTFAANVAVTNASIALGQSSPSAGAATAG
jgi:hypothetical protein